MNKSIEELNNDMKKADAIVKQSILDERHPRKCAECGDGMSEGYMIGFETYCSDKCRQTIMSDKEWEKHYTDDGDDCWTTWELEDGDEIFDGNGILVPTCSKCGSEFEEEIWKTPATDYEEYICSNEKCCAVHTINIERHQFQAELDIERDWSSLEFSYIWEQGLKNDEPKDETLKKLTDIVNWVEGKYDGDALREHMIVKTIKEDLLS